MSGQNLSRWEQDEEEQPGRPATAITAPKREARSSPGYVPLPLVQELPVPATAGSAEVDRIPAEHPRFVNCFVSVSHVHNRFHFFFFFNHPG